MYVKDYLTFWDPVWIKVFYIFNHYLLLLLFYVYVLPDEVLRIGIDYQRRVMFGGIFFLCCLFDLKSEEEGIQFIEF